MYEILALLQQLGQFGIQLFLMPFLLWTAICILGIGLLNPNYALE